MNFRSATLFFFLLLLVLNLIKFIICPCDFFIFNHFCHHPCFYYLPLIILYLVAPFILSFYPCSGFHYKPVICRKNTTSKVVALTFDDGPDPHISPVILDILRKKNVTSTFFIMGKHIPNHEAIVKRMSDEGHILGNHSYAHTNFWDFWPAKRIYRDIIQTETLIQTITGSKPMFFRPPYGVINPMVSRAIRKTSYKVIAWSNWSKDTLIREPEILLKRVIRKLTPGDIILMHDNQKITAGILERLIDEIHAKGFRIIPLDQLINLD